MLDLTSRFDSPPEPWSEGRTIPWDDPAFSARMLKEHLSQAHDGASRRDSLIETHIAFIERECLTKSPARILDLGCGPGLYCLRLAGHGHDCTGIDFSPASVDYARAEASKRGLDSQGFVVRHLETRVGSGGLFGVGASKGRCRFELGDIRNVRFDGQFDLVMLLYGELNLFPPADTDVLLQTCRDALAPGGRLLLEVHSYNLTKSIGSRAPRWSVVQSGLFSDRPHLRCDQSFWLEVSQHAMGRHWVVDAETGEVRLYGWTQKAYEDAEYEALLARNGLRVEARHPSLMGKQDDAGFPVYVASRA